MSIDVLQTRTLKTLLLPAAILFLVTTCSVAPPPGQTGGGYVAGRPTLATVIVTGDRVNLRAGPGMHFEVVGGSKAGDHLDVVSRQGGWLEVKRSGGRTAWIGRRLTREGSATENQPDLLPDLGSDAGVATDQD